VRAGTLRKLGMLQQRAGARDAMGGDPDSWTDLKRVRYAIQTTVAREMQSADNIRAVATSTITLRYMRDLEVDPGMRIRREPNRYEDTAYYNITAVNDVNGAHHELELTVIEDRTASA
jgi:SPP1 family predicted phage head-tail adaptor